MKVSRERVTREMARAFTIAKFLSMAVFENMSTRRDTTDDVDEHRPLQRTQGRVPTVGHVLRTYTESVRLTVAVLLLRSPLVRGQDGTLNTTLLDFDPISRQARAQVPWQFASR